MQKPDRLILILSLFHILTIASSNYLVQIPFQVFGMHTTWGAFTFPFIFLATDLTVRLFGRQPAQAIIFRAMFPAIVVSYMVSVLFSDGQFQSNGLSEFNPFVARIALASFLAYIIGQLMDITVFNKLRQLSAWWVAPAASTIFGNLVDTISFFGIAFHGSSDPFMAEHWTEFALVDYGWKLVISMLLFLPLYGVLLNRIQRYLTKSA
ncbi:7-cyano-7-deazaguanine/7-aminomethyl-7-deazaguanine transporter [Sansalvadorimonas sp. 2012CJ34-2]|uniref:Probable queuosine precursor transporter n=1 Tax=Parendozoicomonas callyspongiae TaxID=2942213 RepID=A0ABT0PK35_9GAMM|nr:7-cyano-7-deazaguanine/7-aminomethyl-7-deazaguanine transporter [Sansalvadorimonas sp. 2012CJ34-2]MCL6271750.1 7-cyano-7-deazaguanine/7-aminomethyl-7-deazaguanine transporter [Sansalvadorimonas sp. 2012CJ34-2]